ncbi:MAG: tetratricopeptide repeat protein [Myxococcota bacterium]
MSCPRCGTPVAPGAGAPPPPPPGPGAPPAYAEGRPDSTLFGLPAQDGPPTSDGGFAAPGIETPAGEGFGGLDAPMPPNVPDPSPYMTPATPPTPLSADMAPQPSTDPSTIGEFDFGGTDSGGLQLDVGGGADAGGAGDALDLPAPAVPRPPAPPRRPPPAPGFGLEQGQGATPGVGGLDLPAPSARQGGVSNLNLPKAPGAAPPPPVGVGGLDLPAPAQRRGGPGPKAPPPPPAHAGAPMPSLELDLPAPAAGGGRGGPVGLNLPDGSDLDLPAPTAGSDLPTPVGLDLPAGTDLHLPAPVGGADVQPVDNMVAPASNLVAPAGLDLEPAGTGLAPAEMGVESREAGGLAPKVAGAEGADAFADRPGFATPRGPTPRAIEDEGSSRRLIYLGAAAGLLALLGGGLYMAGVFDDAPPPPERGLVKKPDGGEKKKPDPAPVGPVAERADEVLAMLDADTPQGYADAAAASEKAGDAVGQAEALLLQHLRYGPDMEAAKAGAAAYQPFAASKEPFVQRVAGLIAITNGKFEAAEGVLAGEGPRTAAYRALMRLRQGRPGDALSEAKAAGDSTFAKVLGLEAQLQQDPAKGFSALQTAAKTEPKHAGMALLLTEAALERGALRVASDTVAGLASGEGDSAGYKARVAAVRGKVAAAQGDYASAMAQFDASLEAAPDSPPVLEAKVRAGIDGKLFAPALEAMDALRKLDAKSVETQLLDIELKVASGKGDEALASLDALEKADAERIEIPFYRGEVQAMRLQVDEAQAEYAKVLEKEPGYHRVALSQAAMLAAARQPVEAVAALDAGVARASEAKMGPSVIAELLVAKARLQLDQGQSKAALAALDKALAGAPEDNAAQVLRGVTRSKTGDTAGGKADLIAVYDRAGGYPGLVAPLGKIFAAQGELDKLEGLVGQRASDPNASNEVKLVAARLRLAQGKPEDAKTLADEVIARSSNAWEAQLVMAEAFLAAGDPQAALTRIEGVRPPEPNADAAVLKGKILEFNGKHPDARTEYRRAVGIDPDHLEARFLYGRLLAYAGQAKQALTELQTVTAATDRFPRAYLNIGRAQRDLGQNDAALGAFAKALELDAALYEAHYLAGRVLLERNKPAKAVTELKAAAVEAANAEVWYPESLLFLGRAQEKAGKRGAAKKTYEAFLKAAPEGHSSRAAVERTIKSL